MVKFTVFLKRKKSCFHHRHKFKCCSKDGVVRSQCSPTAWVNDYDKELNFAAENGFYISGVISRHDNHYE